MTKLIQQRTNNDCVLASIAMAVGAGSWLEAWTDEDLAAVVASKGVSNYEPWFARHGLKPNTDYREVYVHGDTQGLAKSMLWNRRALISVSSLNHEHGHHSVYFDGTRIWDPNEGVPGKLAFRFLSSVNMSRMYLFK